MDLPEDKEYPLLLTLAVEAELPENEKQRTFIESFTRLLNSMKLREFEVRNDTMYCLDADFWTNVECTIWFKYHGKYESHSRCRGIFSVLRNFFHGTSNMEYFKTHVLPCVQLSAFEWFSTSITSCHSNVPLNMIAFGVMSPSLLLNHFVVRSFSNDNRSLNAKGRLSSGNKGLNASFEYDRNCIFVEFFSTEDKKDKRGCPVKYSIQVQFSQVRAVVVDLGDTALGVGSSKYKRLHLDLTWPAQVKKAHAETEAELEVALKIRLKRYLDIRQNGSASHPLALVDNSVLTLEFSREIKDDELFHILSRLRRRCNTPIEFRPVEMVLLNHLNDSTNPYSKWAIVPSSIRNVDIPATHPADPIFSQFLEETFPVLHEIQEPSYINRQKRVVMDRHAVHFWIETLLSRGNNVKDQLLLSEVHWKTFLIAVSQCYRISNEACLEALKQLVSGVDQNRRIGFLTKNFLEIFDHLNQMMDPSHSDMLEGYQLVRKVVVTPSRVVRVAPEMCMGNRVLREQNSELDMNRVIRVVFRDDDNGMLRTVKTSSHHLRKTIERAFDEGLVIAGQQYRYLGSSSSQMRDNGAYFMVGITDEHISNWNCMFPKSLPPPNLSIQMFRINQSKLLQIPTVWKFMARFGQFFTQSRESTVVLRREDYIVIPDITGGRNHKNELYCFTDGVGLISRSLVEEIKKDMQLNCLSSCFQFRFRGNKGVLCFDPYLDEVANHMKKHGVVAPVSGVVGVQPTWEKLCVFRNSQVKFPAKRFETQPLEVVKYSGPTTVCLNKPLINIFDQLSEKQSLMSHKRICARIERLLDIQLRGLVKVMLYEHDSRNKLKELPRRIDFDLLEATSGFEVTTEPFFKSLLRAIIKCAVVKQLRKEQIPIPPQFGRAMLGVADTSGRLQYGQIFVQYHKDVTDYSPPTSAVKIVLTGDVMVTKNPSNVMGDLRRFTAVDIPELHHLVDVIVFPVHGIRPHPDEMAGSDLDGDEYSVFWDPELVIDYNEAAHHYIGPDVKVDEEMEKLAKNVSLSNLHDFRLDEKCRDKFIEYVIQDAVGVISNALLFQSDLYGLDSEIASTLANKATMAVDFPKSGIPPAPLTNRWSHDEGDVEDSLPPEKPERYPDFHPNNDHTPIYISRRLTGKLYREIRVVEDVLRSSEEHETAIPVEIDSDLIVEGWEEYKDDARVAMENYSSKIRAVLSQYGIISEAELFTSQFSEFRNKVTDKDHDDFSYYNTKHVIENRVTEVFKSFRERFFEEYGGWKHCTQAREERDLDSVLRRSCPVPSQSMKQKASAYYQVAYAEARDSDRAGEMRILSFPWVAYDILGHIKKSKSMTKLDHVVTLMPLASILQAHCKEYLSHNTAKFDYFIEDIGRDRVVDNYLNQFRGLDVLLFILDEWAQGFGINLRSSAFRSEHLAQLFIMFATDCFGFIEKQNRKKICIIKLCAESVADRSGMEILYPMELLVMFFEFLASQDFKRLEKLSFKEIGGSSIYVRGEWLPLGQAGLQTYFGLVFSNFFRGLHLDNIDFKSAESVREMDPFVIELPDNADLDLVREKLKFASDCEEIQLRRLRNRRVTVICRGTVDSYYKLRSCVSVIPQAHSGFNIDWKMPEWIYMKILSLETPF